MAKALLLHLSDIHTKGDSDAVLFRADQIAAAVQNIDHDLEAAVVVITGDLAYSGEEHQYIAFWEFLDSLAARLGERLNHRVTGERVPVKIVAIPGNHDLYLRSETTIRDLLIRQLQGEPSLANKKSVIDACTEVQGAFFETLTVIESPPSVEVPGRDKRLTFQYKIEVGDEHIQVYCFNSAWMSRLHEVPGTLFLPEGLVSEKRPSNGAVLVLFHHPYNWIQPDSQRAFRKRVEVIADIIMTGHEHDGGYRAQELYTGERNLYIEGWALQEDGEGEKSAFNAIILDLTNRRQKYALLRWDGGAYVIQESQGEGDDALGLRWEGFQAERLRAGAGFEIGDEVETWLRSMGSPILHKQRGALKLDDVFIFPDVQRIVYPDFTKGEIVRSAGVPALFTESPYILILGESQSGKSSLAKKIFLQLARVGFVPIILSGLRKPPVGERLKDLLVREFERQYGDHSTSAYLQLDKASRVIIVDDYHNVDLSTTQRVKFLEGLHKFAGRIILFSNGLVQEARDLFDPSGRADAATPFVKYRILPFSKVTRNDLIEKWLMLEEGQNTDGIDFAYRREELMRVFDSLTASNRLPRYPIFLLTILSGIEALVPIDPKIGTHGAYYDLLIRTALLQGQDAANYSISQNFLAYLARDMFATRRTSVDHQRFRSITKEFETRFAVSLDAGSILKSMVDRQMLVRTGDDVSFTHPYILYFFAAMWLRDHIGEMEVRDSIRRLARNVHIEGNANLLLFLAHLSKDPIILEEVASAAKSLHADLMVATFEEDVAFLAAMRDPSKSPMLIDGDVNERRREIIEMEGEQERETDLASNGSDADAVFGDGEEDLGPVGSMVSAMKTVEILGQILKNFPGTLEADDKYRIASEGFGLGLRTVTLLYDRVRENHELLLDELRAIVKRHRPDATKLENDRQARDMMVGVCEALGAALVQLIAQSMGTAQLDQTYERVAEANPIITVELINASIALEYNKNFPERKVLDLSARLMKKPFAKAVLQALVIMRFTTFPAPMATRQKVCRALDINYPAFAGAVSQLQAHNR